MQLATLRPDGGGYWNEDTSVPAIILSCCILHNNIVGMKYSLTLASTIPQPTVGWAIYDIATSKSIAELERSDIQLIISTIDAHIMIIV